jgi:GntR family transcriptional regulator, phosphonate transport system regulatory protein
MAKPESRTVPLARWRTIADELLRDLSGGKLSPGDKLPTEHELAERFRVNRHTIRRALSVLADGGFVRVEHGRGSFVAEHVLEYALGRRTRFSANVIAQGREPDRRVLGIEVVEAPEATQRALKLKRGADVIRLRTAGFADGIPISMSANMFPTPRFKRLPELVKDSLSITAALRDMGVEDYTRGWTKLLTRLPTEEEARMLHQPVTRPVLEVEALDIDSDGRPITHGTGIFAGDRVQLTVGEID